MEGLVDHITSMLNERGRREWPKKYYKKLDWLFDLSIYNNININLKFINFE